jgi:DNA mismatch repair protein MutL
MQLFVNRRALQPRGALVAVIEEAYHTMLMKGRHPLVVLNIQVHPIAVDVNVHPTKSEVKFRYAPSVHSLLGRSTREALLGGASTPTWSEDEGTVQRRFELRQLGQANPVPRAAPSWDSGTNWGQERSRWEAGAVDAAALTPSQPEPLERQAAAAPTPSAEPQPTRLPALRIMGQAGLTYIVADSPEGIYLIDQHAAHERVTYERLINQHAGGAVESQNLLLPQTVALSPAASTLLLGNQERLTEWGFDIAEWGEGVLVRAVPATLPAAQLTRALHELADHLAERGGSTPLDWREAMLTTLSCHTSVRAGQQLAPEEMRQLIQQLEACVSPRTCPHGRPTMILLTPAQLERQFGRRA